MSAIDIPALRALPFTDEELATRLRFYDAGESCLDPRIAETLRQQRDEVERLRAERDYWRSYAIGSKLRIKYYEFACKDIDLPNAPAEMGRAIGTAGVATRDAEYALRALGLEVPHV